MFGMFFRTVDFPPQGILVSDRSSLRCIKCNFLLPPPPRMMVGTGFVAAVDCENPALTNTL